MAETLIQSIFMDYDDVLAKAEEMDECANSLERSGNQVMENWASTHPWSGESADAYNQKLIRFQARLQSEVDNLRTTSNTLKEIANRLKQADEAAARVAQQILGH